MIRPEARSEGLVVETLDGEVLVYDTTCDRAHCLSAPAAAVWRVCDGKSTVAEVALAAGVEESLACSALQELDKAQLLRQPLPKMRPSRRQLLVGAVVVPLVLSIAAPAAAQAASCLGFRQPCTVGGTPCCPGRSCRDVRPFGFICV